MPTITLVIGIIIIVYPFVVVTNTFILFGDLNLLRTVYHIGSRFRKPGKSRTFQYSIGDIPIYFKEFTKVDWDPKSLNYIGNLLNGGVMVWQAGTLASIKRASSIQFTGRFSGKVL